MSELLNAMPKFILLCNSWVHIFTRRYSATRSSMYKWGGIIDRTDHRLMLVGTTDIHDTRWLSCMSTGALSTKSLWDHDSNCVTRQVALTSWLLIQTCHNFAHVMTTQLLWHVPNCYLLASLESKLDSEKIEFPRDFNHKLINPFVWEVPDRTCPKYMGPILI